MHGSSENSVRCTKSDSPAKPPVYPGNLPTPGTVTLNTVAGATSVSTVFTITAPSITTGISAPSNTTNTLGLGATLIVYAYAVGSTNNALTAQVNGATGGSATYGTLALVPQGIYGEYLYTAPATMPMTGSTVTLTVVSQADPTKSSTLTLTLH